MSDNGKLGHDDEYPYEDHDDGHFEVHNRPNWGNRASWMSRDDSPPRPNGRPNGGIRSIYTTYDNSPPGYHQRTYELMNRPSLDTKPNWPSRSESSPPEIMMQSRMVSYPNSDTRPKYYESSHPKSNPRSNCTKAQDNSPPKRANPIASQRPNSTRPLHTGVKAPLVTIRSHGECVVNQPAIDSLEARRRYVFTQVDHTVEFPLKICGESS
nr:serine/arginine repetitive matrix protein 1-like isoform X2 [Ipomoea batatas]